MNWSDLFFLLPVSFSLGVCAGSLLMNRIWYRKITKIFEELSIYFYSTEDE